MPAPPAPESGLITARPPTFSVKASMRRLSLETSVGGIRSAKWVV